MSASAALSQIDVHCACSFYAYVMLDLLWLAHGLLATRFQLS